MPWVGLHYAIVVFPDHTHLLLLNLNGGVIHLAEKAGENITFYQATKTWINMRFFRHISRPTVASSRILTVHYPVALDVCIYTQSINTEGIKFSSFSSFFYSFLRTSFRHVGGIYNKVLFKVSRAVYISVTPYKKEFIF